MATRDSKLAQGTSTDRVPTELGRELPNGPPARAERTHGGPIREAGADVRAEIELILADLISDDRGEIVFFNDSGVRSLGITTSAAVVANGRAEPHVTAGGADVAGFEFVAFDNGLTLYFERELDLIVHPEPAAT